MYVYRIASTNPMENLAIEEVCFKYWDQSEPLLLLWQNEDAIVVGKHQNPYEEVNMAYALRHKIPVLRRISGGGTVYHDLGNVNYSLIYGNSRKVVLDVTEISQVLIKGLVSLGLKIELSPRHDLRLGDKKISGTAQARSGAQILHHGTLLFQSDLPKLKEALRVDHVRIDSKSVPSVPSSVTNIRSHMKSPCSVTEFLKRLVEGIGRSYPIKEWTLPTCLRPEVLSLVKDKYTQWEWNYGRSKYYAFERQVAFTWGKVLMSIELNKGLVDSITIKSEIGMADQFQLIEKHLIGQRYDESHLDDLLMDMGSQLGGASHQIAQ